jgi:hypothetical protein
MHASFAGRGKAYCGGIPSPSFPSSDRLVQAENGGDMGDSLTLNMLESARDGFVFAKDDM